METFERIQQEMIMTNNDSRIKIKQKYESDLNKDAGLLVATFAIAVLSVTIFDCFILRHFR